MTAAAEFALGMLVLLSLAGIAYAVVGLFVTLYRARHWRGE